MALVLSMILTLGFSNAVNVKNEDVNLTEYQLALDELNIELGTNFTIPDDEQAISITLSMTPNELKESLK